MDIPSTPTVAPRRHAAGQDPAKRETILGGAAQVFLDSGFDAASVNDICRSAGVSKSTLYVYFASKEDLFEALVERERDRLFSDVEKLLSGDATPTDKLRHFTYRLAEIICSPQVVRAQRTVISIAERMPELGARFYDGGARRAQRVLSRYLEGEVQAGTLAIPDPCLAASQLVVLATADLWRKRLFGKITQPPSSECLSKTTNSAVALFMAAYGKNTDR